MTDPALPEIGVFPDMDLEAFETMIQAIKNIERIGTRIIINATNIEIIQTAWVRNFEDEIIYPGTIATNIAEYLAFKRAYYMSLKH